MNEFLEYPKIDTLYDRDEKFFVDTTKIRNPEFLNINRWMVTEKIHGDNVRVMTQGSGLLVGGRTAAADLKPGVLQLFEGNFHERMIDVFGGADAILFGEAYGAKIQKGGGNYRPDSVSYRIFDVVVFDKDGYKWWLSWPNIEDVAAKLEFKTVPVIAEDATLIEAISLVKWASITANQDSKTSHQQEGVVARTEPGLWNRKGDWVRWKLKRKDYPRE